jgi:hypothetical protein
MLTQHTVWAQILTDLGMAMPPQPKTAAEAKAKPRQERDQVVLNGITTTYNPNMANILTMNENDFKNLSPNGEAPTVVPATDPSAAPPPSTNNPRGFLITLKCTTPNKQGSTFVQQKLISKLATLTADQAFKDRKTFYIAKAAVVSETSVKNDPNMTAGSSAPAAAYANPNTYAPQFGGGRQAYPGYGGSGGMRNRGYGRSREGMYRPGPQYVPNAPNTAAPSPTTRPGDPETTAPAVPYPDPQTGEDMGDDKSLTVLIAVILDPPPPAPKDPNAATASPRASAQ